MSYRCSFYSQHIPVFDSRRKKFKLLSLATIKIIILTHFNALNYYLEAWAGIEPAYRGFAVPCLTTWLPRLYSIYALRVLSLEVTYSMIPPTTYLAKLDNGCFSLETKPDEKQTYLLFVHLATTPLYFLTPLFYLSRDFIYSLTMFFPFVYLEINKWNSS